MFWMGLFGSVPYGDDHTLFSGAATMPEGFDSCVRRGGRVRTMPLGSNKYRHVCFIDGKSFVGEVHTKKKDEAKDKKSKG